MDLVLLLIHRDLGQHHAVRGPIGGEQMETARAAARNVAAYGLAIERDDDTGTCGNERLFGAPQKNTDCCIDRLRLHRIAQDPAPRGRMWQT